MKRNRKPYRQEMKQARGEVIRLLGRCRKCVYSSWRYQQTSPGASIHEYCYTCPTYEQIEQQRGLLDGNRISPHATRILQQIEEVITNDQLRTLIEEGLTLRDIAIHAGIRVPILEKRARAIKCFTAAKANAAEKKRRLAEQERRGHDDQEAKEW